MYKFWWWASEINIIIMIIIDVIVVIIIIINIYVTDWHPFQDMILCTPKWHSLLYIAL